MYWNPKTRIALAWCLFAAPLLLMAQNAPSVDCGGVQHAAITVTEINADSLARIAAERKERDEKCGIVRPNGSGDTTAAGSFSNLEHIDFRALPDPPASAATAIAASIPPNTETVNNSGPSTPVNKPTVANTDIIPSGTPLSDHASEAASSTAISTSKPSFHIREWVLEAVVPQHQASQAGNQSVKRTYFNKFNVEYQVLDLDTWKPISAQTKFNNAMRDIVDPFTNLSLAGSAWYSWSLNDQSYMGPGWRGYGNRLWTGAADNALGDVIGGAILPIIFHEDPRYLAMDHGGIMKRSVYAASRVLFTKNDYGHNTINKSHILGVFAVATLSNLYYPKGRADNLDSTMYRAGIGIASDAAYNLFAEFWPDFARKIRLNVFLQNVVRQILKSNLNVN